ncbi:MAG TPA: type IV pilus secretin PilQ [Burkholderiales bacterium]|nr:type IV pilus secretin PilQ [Burkholderiales bacterium]
MTIATGARKAAHCIIWLLLGMAALGAAAQQFAPSGANSIEDIKVNVQQSGDVVVQIVLKQPLAGQPGAFTINNPPRIAFDFPNTVNALGKNTQDVGQGDLRAMNIVQVGDRTRLVMNLLKPLGYDTRIDGNNLIVTLQGAATPGAAAAAPLPSAAAHFAEAQPSQEVRHSLRDVSFRRGPNGEGKIIVDLSDTGIGIDLHQQGANLIIDFIDTALPKNLEKHYDAVDFATPVQTYDVLTEGNNARILISPKGLWEHAAYQTDKQFIVDVKPIVEDPTKLIQGSHVGYTGEKLSLNFQNVEVRAVLQVIADFTGFNFITSDSVSGNLTLRLKDVPWDQALKIILDAKGLDMRKDGNVVWIAPRDEIAVKEKQALQSQQDIEDLEPLRTESFQLNYQKADAVQSTLTNKEQRILSKRGSAVVDARTNTIFVQDTPSHLEQVRQLLRKIDVPVRQVEIQARIVEASDTFSRNLGARLGVTDRGTANGPPGDTLGGKAAQRVSVGGSLDATGFFTTQVSTPIPTLDQALGVNLPATGIGGASPGVFSVILFNEALSRFLNMEVSALQADGKGKIISSPRVVTADQKEASIESGTEIPYQQASSSGATTVSFKKATLSLKVTPQVTPDDNIIMALDIHKDSPGANTTAGPSIDTKQITTEVLVQNGGTVVIGGIYTQTQNDSTNKVPVLGDLPYVGFLFRQNQKQDDRNELLIFISPRIIKDNLTVR